MNGKSWSENDIETLRKLYPCRPTREVAEALGCSVSRIYSKAIDLRIAKTQEFLDSPESGRAHKGDSRPWAEATRFKKGMVPFNKGMRRPGWHAGRMRETQFNVSLQPRAKACPGCSLISWTPIWRTIRRW